MVILKRIQFYILYDVYKLLSVIVAFDCTQVPRIQNILYLYPSVISWAESDTAGVSPFYACFCLFFSSLAAVQLKGATFCCIEPLEASLVFPVALQLSWNLRAINKLTDPSGQPKSVWSSLISRITRHRQMVTFNVEKDKAIFLDIIVQEPWVNIK